MHTVIFANLSIPLLCTSCSLIAWPFVFGRSLSQIPQVRCWFGMNVKIQPYKTETWSHYLPLYLHPCKHSPDDLWYSFILYYLVFHGRASWSCRSCELFDLRQSPVSIYHNSTLQQKAINCIPSMCFKLTHYIFLFTSLVFAVLMIQQLAVFASFSKASMLNAYSACVILLLILFSGFIVSPGSIPSYLYFFYWWNPFAWTYRALVVSEFRSDRWLNPDR